MKNIRYLLVTSICLASGVLFFLIQRKWLIIHWAFSPIQSNITITDKDNSFQKKVRIFFWKDSKIRHEDAIVIWNNENKNETLKRLADSWLSVLHDEKVFIKKIKIETVSLGESEQEAFISFNQIFPWQEWSIHQKWTTIECLLKTIKEAELGINFVNFLVNEKPLEDTHLSFIQPWPIDGFK